MAQVHRFIPPVSDSNGSPVKLMERSLFSARYCFVQNLHQSGLMNDAEFAVYEEYFNFLTREPELRVDLIIYLKASPNVCLQRALSRKRKEESKLTIEYLTRLDQLHDDWLLHPRPDQEIAPVLSIPADAPKDVLNSIFLSVAPYVLGEKVWSEIGSIPCVDLVDSRSKFQNISLKFKDENVAIN